VFLFALCSLVGRVLVRIGSGRFRVFSFLSPLHILLRFTTQYKVCCLPINIPKIDISARAALFVQPKNDLHISFMYL
jgi:hypothetical protein